MDKKNLNNNNKVLNKGKVAAVLDSIAQLFQPFKDIITNILPSSKIIISVLDFIGRSISRIVLFIAGFIPKLITFIKSKIFKFIVLVILLIIVFNTVISRVINTPTSKQILARAITESTGYQAVIEGRVYINFLLMSLTIYNTAFYSHNNKNSEISLNLLSVNHLKIKFSFLSMLLGHLKPKKVEINKAEIRYKSVAQHVGEDKFLGLIRKINDVTNLSMVLPSENVNTSVSTASNDRFSNTINKNIDTLLPQKNHSKDDINKYINLKDIFAPKNKLEKPVFMNIDEKGLLFKIFKSVISKFTFNLNGLNKLSFSNVIFKLIDSDNKTILLIDNLSGELKKSFISGITLEGETRFLNKNVFFNFNHNSTEKGNKFNLVVSYENNKMTTKDLVIEGWVSKNHDINGCLKASGEMLKSIITETADNDFIKSQDSVLKSDFKYSQSILMLSNLELLLNNTKNTGSIIYNFSGSGIVELDLNLGINNIDDLFRDFSSYRQGKHGSTIYIFSEMLLEWITNRNRILNPKYFAVNLNIDNTLLHNIPSSNIVLNAFVDNNDNLYINHLQLHNKDFNFTALGKIQLVNKSGTLIVNSEGNVNSLGKYISNSDNLNHFLYSIADYNDYSLSSKVFLTDDRIVFNDINGHFGNKTIKYTNATLVERNNIIDLLISSKFEVINFSDLYKIYNFNKNVGRLYYDTNSQIIGIPESLKIHLNIYGNNFIFKDLKFSNFQMEGTIISSGILLHSFSFNDSNNIGSVSGSFNFNDHVSPSIIGNIDFNNILLQTESLNNMLFSNYNIAGKVVLNGNINISGDNYYNGVNKVNGRLSLIKYERLKINKENKSQGVYLTLMKLNFNNKEYYQIGDLYGNINIFNNKINLSPNIIRYIDGSTSYRGMLNGEFDILKNTIDLKGVLESENNNNNKKELIINGTLDKLEIK